MFEQLSAWFADDVSRATKNLWTDNDGIITTYPHSAYFLFIDNPGSKQAYEQIIDDHSDFIGLACITVDWISECIRKKEMIPCKEYAIDKEETVIQYREIYLDSLKAYEEEQEKERKRLRDASYKSSTSNGGGSSRYNEEDYKFRKQNVPDIRNCYRHPNSAGLNDLSEFIESFKGNDSAVNKFIDFKIDNGNNNGFKVTRIPKDHDEDDGIYEKSGSKNKNNNNGSDFSPKSKNKKSSTKDGYSSGQTSIIDYATPIPINKANNGNNSGLATSSSRSNVKDEKFYTGKWVIDKTPPKPSSGIVKEKSANKPKPPPTKTINSFDLDDTMDDMEKNEDQKNFKKQEFEKSPFYPEEHEVQDDIEDENGITSISSAQFDSEVGYSKNKAKQSLQFHNSNTNTKTSPPPPPKPNNGTSRKRPPTTQKTTSASHLEIVVLDDDDD